jgi:hypothetical protein
MNERPGHDEHEHDDEPTPGTTDDPRVRSWPAGAPGPGDYGATEDEQRRLVGQPRDVAP